MGAMDIPNAVWGALFLAGAAYETFALIDRQDGNTLSETTRRLFRVRNSVVGRWTFGTGWTVFAVWFWGHILYGWPFPFTQ